MKSLFNILTLFLILALFALPTLAQGESEELPAWMAALPTVLAGLVFANFKATETFKRLLQSSHFGGVPPKDIQNILVLGFSILLGIASAWFTPTATDWLSPAVRAYPVAAIILTGLTVSAIGGGVYELLNRLSAGVPVYSTTTTINTPPTDTSNSTAKETMSAVSQAVKADK